MTIETTNLILVPGDIEYLTSAISGNKDLGKNLGVLVDDHWTEFGIDPLQYSLNKLLESEQEFGWWTYFPIHKKDNTLIGSCGYKGKPTKKGLVEIGYEIALGYRNQGLATELAMALIIHAFKNSSVKTILAHTLPQENPSTKILLKCGFDKIGTIYDPEDGEIWRWELKKFLWKTPKGRD